jgi:hypothetical protein
VGPKPVFTFSWCLGLVLSGKPRRLFYSLVFVVFVFFVRSIRTILNSYNLKELK